MKTLLIFLCVSTNVLAGDVWPAFRGPTGQCITDEKNLPLKWNGKTGENVV